MLQSIKQGFKTLLIGFVIFFIEQIVMSLVQILCTNSDAKNFYAGTILSLLSVCALMYFTYWIFRNKIDFTNPGLTMTKKRLAKIIVITVVIIYFLTTIYVYICSTLHIHGASFNQKQLMNQGHSPNAIMFYVIVTILLAPPVEEFVFRYLIMHKQTKILTRKLRAVISVVLFTYIHVSDQIALIDNLASLKATLYVTGQYFILAIVFVALYYKYNDLRINIMTHMTYNLCALCISLL